MDIDPTADSPLFESENSTLSNSTKDTMQTTTDDDHLSELSAKLSINQNDILPTGTKIHYASPSVRRMSDESMEIQMEENITRLKQLVFEATNKSLLADQRDKNFKQYDSEAKYLNEKLQMAKDAYRFMFNKEPFMTKNPNITTVPSNLSLF